MSEQETLSAKDELKRCQRKFIPINIITFIISLVAGLTLLFTPFLSIDAGVLVQLAEDENAEEQGTVYNSPAADSEKPDDESGSSEKGMSEDEIIMALIMRAFDSKLSFTPLDFAAFAKNDDPAKALLSAVFVENNLIEDIFTAGVGAGMAIMAGTGENYGLTEEDLDLIDAEKIASFVKKATTDEIGAKEDFRNSVLEVAEKLGIEVGENFDADIDKAFGDFISSGKATDDSPFSLEYLVCNTAGKVISGEEQTNVGSYDELLSLISDEYIYENVDASTVSIICWAVFGIVAFPAAMWLLLALLSALHILLKNKTFLTWYVKLTGLLPCLLFGIAPFLVEIFIDSSNANLLVALGALGTFTWISGVCFLALAILSVGFIYPRRRRIRQLRREAR